MVQCHKALMGDLNESYAGAILKLITRTALSHNGLKNKKLSLESIYFCSFIYFKLQ